MEKPSVLQGFQEEGLDEVIIFVIYLLGSMAFAECEDEERLVEVCIRWDSRLVTRWDSRLATRATRAKRLFEVVKRLFESFKHPKDSTVFSYRSTVCRSLTPRSGVEELEDGVGRRCATRARSRDLGEPQTGRPELLPQHQRWWHGGHPAVHF